MFLEIPVVAYCISASLKPIQFMSPSASNMQGIPGNCLSAPAEFSVIGSIINIFCCAVTDAPYKKRVGPAFAQETRLMWGVLGV